MFGHPATPRQPVASPRHEPPDFPAMKKSWNSRPHDSVMGAPTQAPGPVASESPILSNACQHDSRETTIMITKRGHTAVSLFQNRSHQGQYSGSPFEYKTTDPSLSTFLKGNSPEFVIQWWRECPGKQSHPALAWFLPGLSTGFPACPNTVTTATTAHCMKAGERL